MSEVETFFRFCPGCGKRFHIKLVSKKLVEVKRETFEQKRAVMMGRMSMQYGRQGGGFLGNPTVLEESIPVTVDVEDFQYTYRCKHCGHEWTENHVETQKAG